MRRDEALAKDFARRHGVPRYYTDADQLIHDPDINAIYVATPPSTHKEYAIRALEVGKPVYVEKPMAMNYGECMEMLMASERTGQKLFVAYYRRALPYFRKVKELLDSRLIGRILSVEIHYTRPPQPTDLVPEQHTWRIRKSIAGDGYFYDLAPHTLDILDFLLGEITEARGFTQNLGGLYEATDTLSAILQFRSGVVGTGLWSFVTSPASTEDSIRITGVHGEISFNTFAFQPIRLVIGECVQTFETTQPEHIQQPLIQTIVDELLGNGRCPSTALSGARTSRIIDSIYLSIENINRK
jgi:predicted dehydrogenase